MGEYEQLTFEELLLKAMDVRIDSAPLLAEAQQRDLSAIQELVAVTGVPLTQEWTAIALIPWPSLPVDREIALCWRLTPAPPPASTRESGPELRQGGGVYSSVGRNRKDD